jgi:hypothetical protein
MIPVRAFILSFTNKSIEYFAKTEFAQYEAEEIDVVVDDSGATVKQYICHRIWNIYRGTQVAPELLESIHMALEKWLLMVAKTATPEVLESWCLYLMKHSRSASITAIVASVVLAESPKLFNVAKLLFRTKELFFFDTARMQLDMSAKGKDKHSRFYSKEIIHNYLLAWSFWKREAREWHSLKDREKLFFKRVSEDMGGNPATLHSLSKFLNDIGSGFKDDGIHWLSDMLDKNPELSTEELEVNTVYYLETLVRSYVIRNRNQIKKSLQLKNRLLIILDYLLSKGSETAYLIREDIL